MARWHGSGRPRRRRRVRGDYLEQEIHHWTGVLILVLLLVVTTLPLPAGAVEWTADLPEVQPLVRTEPRRQAPAEDSVPPPVWSPPAPSAPAGAARATVTATPRPTVATVPPTPVLTFYELAAARYGVSADMLRALHEVESGSLRGGCLANSEGTGALGPYQFMPETFWAFAVDGNNDGVEDICSFPDAVFTAAHYLRTLGANASATSPETMRALARYGTEPQKVARLVAR